jgi:hypothetical protein
MPQRRTTSKQARGTKRITALLGAADEIAPFDYVAFERKAGELIGRSASARKRGKDPGPRSGSLRKREIPDN